VLIINKMDTAPPENVSVVKDNIARCNPDAVVIQAESAISVSGGEAISGKTVLVVEDGPTLTHGEMKFGAGIVAAEKYGAARIIDPRPYAVGSIKDTFEKYTHLDRVLPAMGYGGEQMSELAETIDRAECDLVVSGTPIDLGRRIQTNKRILRVIYELEEIGTPDLREVLKGF
jgi:predicted GTPase